MFLEPKISSLRTKGSIEVICGSMFSGKTEELIRRLNRLKIAKKKIAAFKPVIDYRYNNKKIVSHNKNSIDATVIQKGEDIIKKITSEDVVAIDEAQFFDISLIATCTKLANSGKRVIVCGLDMDFLGNPFGIMPSILAIAEHVKKMHAICVSCGDIANHSFRINQDKNLIKIGEKKEYEALCRLCFFKKMNSE